MSTSRVHGCLPRDASSGTTVAGTHLREVFKLRRLGRLIACTSVMVLLVGIVPAPAWAYYLCQPTSVTPTTALPTLPVEVCFTFGDDEFTNKPYVVEAWFGLKDAAEFFNCGVTFDYCDSNNFHGPGIILPPGWPDRASDLNTDGMELIYENGPSPADWPDGVEPGTTYCFDYTLPDLIPDEPYYIHLVVGFDGECDNWTHYTFRLDPGGISFDLVGQFSGEVLESRVKIHPTLSVEVSDQLVEYPCLNPSDPASATAEFSFDVYVKSNLPFYKQFTWTDFELEINPDDYLETYRWNEDKGSFELTTVTDPADTPGFPGGPGSCPETETIPTSSVILTEEDGSETELMNGDVFGPIGDCDDHEDTETVTWKVGPIDWCDTAGYYESTMQVCVYQN